MQSRKDYSKKSLIPGVIAIIQAFGDHINFHPHLHFLETVGAWIRQCVFPLYS
jgi:hypothetical protein